MDRSFLSQPVVVAASRQFVCARLATYENEDEGKFLKQLTRTRSGELENSAFCIFAPDSKEKLLRAGRSMKSAYPDAAAMADGMVKLAGRYKPKAEPDMLPLVPDVRLALDVASADNQPLVVVVAKDAARRKELEEATAKLAWDSKFVGRFVYVSCGGGDDLAGVKGADANSVLLVVRPDKYGLKGTVIAQTADAAKLTDALAAGVKAFVPEAKSFRTHVRDGQKDGVFWETKTPVTDPQEAAARERGRKR
jgi:hypothetical protein